MARKRKYVAYRYESDSDDDTTTAYARMVAVSASGRRQVIMPCSPTKNRAGDGVEHQFPLQTDTWESTLGDYFVFDNDVEPQPVMVVKAPAKRYANSDAPLHEWMGVKEHVGFREEYLLEELRLEGRDCFGPEIMCKTCCLLKHAHHPLHIINKWNGIYFERTALADMGLRVQLGHEGMPCLCPQRGHISFVVIHTNAIHRVHVDFCGCHQRISHRQQLLRCEWYPATLHFPQSACTKRVLEFFLVLTWSSKVSGYEFYSSLERLTDNTGLNVPKNRNRSSGVADPGLYTGLAYFVPDKPYTEHSDISTCSGFKTLAHAESKYANMDFIFFSSIIPLLLLSVVISYDIACQWKLNLAKRMNELPEHLQMPAAVTLAAFIFGIPKFHCVGRTDGEGIERNWAEMNRVANSTKEMGAGLLLWRKLLNAIKERGRHQSFLRDFNLTIDDGHRGEWTAMVEAWEQRQIKSESICAQQNQ
ncbi:hypothetical protein DEU56DRAFT_872880 [Suillus clintonianus]|uniref:uncharacterized protein n=1 Tax=Suillus clintonianus TaxID=1904413 RepID=UPI001B8681D8|nr:uncharacterized protein DEU56DRAFT_872880 [Suillus clintonianus]KAG2126618.1 hypothetical protein DEU56DRAFT_872880 [Suillus clintonianus]